MTGNDAHAARSGRDGFWTRRRDAFNRHAADYDAGRPPYPARVYTFMEEIGALRPGATILEIGPGTGQATGELIRRGARIDAIELGSSLAGILRRRLPDDRLDLRVADIHTCPLPAGRYDAVVAATTFHWLDPQHLLPRLARALVPGGWLVVWWNVFGDPHASTSFRDRVSAIFAEQLPAEWREPTLVPPAMCSDDRLRELVDGGWFGAPRQEIIRWTHTMNAAEACALFATFPAIANLDPDARARFLDALAAAVVAEGGMVEDPFVTAMYAVRATAKARRPGE